MNTNNRIVCCEQTECSSSGHIVAVGIGNDPSAASERVTVPEVWAAMDRGVRFYTADSRGNVAQVEKYYCGCRRGSLRSKADASRENNLDSLRLCHWKAA